MGHQRVGRRRRVLRRTLRGLKEGRAWKDPCLCRQGDSKFLEGMSPGRRSANLTLRRPSLFFSFGKRVTAEWQERRVEEVAGLSVCLKEACKI